MPEYVLNLDAPDPTPDPLSPLADYLEPHERDLALMVAFAHKEWHEEEPAKVGTDGRSAGAGGNCRLRCYPAAAASEDKAPF